MRVAVLVALLGCGQGADEWALCSTGTLLRESSTGDVDVVVRGTDAAIATYSSDGAVIVTKLGPGVHDGFLLADGDRIESLVSGNVTLRRVSPAGAERWSHVFRIGGGYMTDVRPSVMSALAVNDRRVGIQLSVRNGTIYPDDRIATVAMFELDGRLLWEASGPAGEAARLRITANGGAVLGDISGRDSRLTAFDSSGKEVIHRTFADAWISDIAAASRSLAKLPITTRSSPRSRSTCRRLANAASPA